MRSTSAPSNASVRVATGPAVTRVRSSTRMPASGSRDPALACGAAPRHPPIGSPRQAASRPVARRPRDPRRDHDTYRRLHWQPRRVPRHPLATAASTFAAPWRPSPIPSTRRGASAWCGCCRACRRRRGCRRKRRRDQRPRRAAPSNSATRSLANAVAMRATIGVLLRRRAPGPLPSPARSRRRRMPRRAHVTAPAAASLVSARRPVELARIASDSSTRDRNGARGLPSRARGLRAKTPARLLAAAQGHHVPAARARGVAPSSSIRTLSSDTPPCAIARRPSLRPGREAPPASSWAIEARQARRRDGSSRRVRGPRREWSSPARSPCPNSAWRETAAVAGPLPDADAWS